MSANNLNKNSGFTIVELLIVISVLAIIGVTFLGIVANYFVTITRTEELTNMTVTSQNLLRTTVENIRFGDGIEQSNQIYDPNQPSGWNTSETNFVIILKVPALNASHNYIIDPNTSDPYMNELVYYKNGTTLMQRTLANPNASGNSLVTSCPPNLATASCPADKQLATYVNTMSFTMFDQNANITSTPSLARSIGITLNMQRNAPESPINLTTSIRVTLRNNF